MRRGTLSAHCLLCTKGDVCVLGASLPVKPPPPRRLLVHLPVITRSPSTS
ncbi:hypothetical protein NDU88_000237 [Pleurodeles waltl]|uniref:Uncharacterized protein n=1 Tax=Pleurodeles waltl TaxID=8319 RepID=A0AAV7P0A3_PLEWA|nr:hypothetical protein NDU88_000237 [Pleurodeles waltl]